MELFVVFAAVTCADKIPIMGTMTSDIDESTISCKQNWKLSLENWEGVVDGSFGSGIYDANIMPIIEHRCVFQSSRKVSICVFAIIYANMEIYIPVTNNRGRAPILLLL